MQHDTRATVPVWLSWANSLTLLRLLAVGPGVWATLNAQWPLAAGLFTLAAVTDLADGPIARRSGRATPLGGLFDHGTDALFVSSQLGALAATGFINPWLPVFVLVAFLQYVFDSHALAGAALRTSQLGRYNGIAYFVLAGIPIYREALGLGWPADIWIAAFAWLLLTSTLASMTDRAFSLYRQQRSDRRVT